MSSLWDPRSFCTLNSSLFGTNELERPCIMCGLDGGSVGKGDTDDKHEIFEVFFALFPSSCTLEIRSENSDEETTETLMLFPTCLPPSSRLVKRSLDCNWKNMEGIWIFNFNREERCLKESFCCSRGDNTFLTVMRLNAEKC